MRISAKTGEGIDGLKDTIETVLRSSKIYLERVFGYDEAGKIAIIRKYGQLLSENYVAEGIEVKAYVPIEIYNNVK